MSYGKIKDDNDITCMICYGILKDPLECSFCSNNFCRECVNKYEKKNNETKRQNLCPYCKNEWKLIENKPFRELLQELRIICTKCKNKFKNEKEFKEHLFNCCKYKCKLCHISLSSEEFLTHIMRNHNKIIIQNFIETPKINSNDSNSLNSLQSTYKVGQDYKKISYFKGDYINLWHKHNEIPFPNDNITIPNHLNLANNNLYYCGKKTNLNCDCCVNGICKEGNCLCVNCMEFNKKLKYLSDHYLINKEARAAKMDNGKFRCRFEYNVTKYINGNKMSSVIQCKFPNEPCPACQILNTLYEKYFENQKNKL